MASLLSDVVAASRRELSITELHRLAAHPKAQIRIEIAMTVRRWPSPDLWRQDVDVINDLALGDPDPRVRAAAMGHPEVGPAACWAALSDVPLVRSVRAVITPDPHEIRLYAVDYYPAVRRAVLHNRRIDTETVSRLLSDPDAAVRRAARRLGS